MKPVEEFLKDARGSDWRGLYILMQNDPELKSILDAAIDGFVNAMENITIPDRLMEDRNRSRNDLNNKRRELRRRKGKL